MTPETKLDHTRVMALMMNDKSQCQTLQLISRNPHTPASNFVISNIAALQRNNVRVEAIFLKMDGSGNNIIKLSPSTLTLEALRYVDCRKANFAEAGNITEQINFGNKAIWTGKRLKAWHPMNMEDGQINDIRASFESQKMASMAFRSLWSVTEPLKVSQTDKQSRKTAPMRVTGIAGG